MLACVRSAVQGRARGTARDSHRPALKRQPVVMLTSSREEQDLITSYDLGVFWALIDEPPPQDSA
jgi:hypothetical protein